MISTSVDDPNNRSHSLTMASSLQYPNGLKSAHEQHVVVIRRIQSTWIQK